MRNALAANLASTIKQAVFSTRVRRHASPLAASLSASNVPVEVFDNLIAAFEANLPTWHRYWRVRRTIHGVEELAPYDVAAPLGASSPVLPYEQCVEWICASLAPLGDAYLAWQSQPQVYSRYSIFVAEVASNFHQALLRAHLFDTVDDRALQLAVLEEAMANFYRYFFVMPTLARLERELHERVDRGEGLTAELLGERTADLFAEGFGPTSSSTGNASGSHGLSSPTCTSRSTCTSTRPGSRGRTRSPEECSTARRAPTPAPST